MQSNKVGLGLALAMFAACRPAPTVAVDGGVPSLGDIDGLMAATALPATARDKTLGARVVAGTRKTEVRRAGVVETLVEEFRLEVDGAGGLRIVHDVGEPPRGDGMEAVLVAGELYVKPRYGMFIHRKPEQGELTRLRLLVEGVVAADLELLGPAVEISVAAPSAWQGRTVRRVTLALAAHPRQRPAERDAGRRWREGIVVDSLSGELVFDDASAVLVAARLDAAYHFPSVERVTIHHEESTAGPPPAISAPATAASPERPRPMLDRHTLLDDIAGQATRSGTPPSGALR